MTGIIDMLPLLRGWRYDAKIISVPELIIKEQDIFRITSEKGWFLSAAGIINNKNTLIRITIDDYHRIEATPFGIHYAGITVPSSSGIWVGTYNETLDIYSTLLTPPYPLWYTKSIAVSLTPPTGETVVLASYGHIFIRIDDEDEFRKSLKELSI